PNEAVLRHARRETAVPNTQSTWSGPSHSGCSRGTRHAALPSTTSSWPERASAAPLPATRPRPRGVLLQMSSSVRYAHSRAYLANRWSWATREALLLRGTPALRERHAARRSKQRPEPDRDRCAIRQDAQDCPS